MCDLHTTISIFKQIIIPVCHEKTLLVISVILFKVIQLLCGNCGIQIQDFRSKAEILNLYCNTASALFISDSLCSIIYLLFSPLTHL